MDKVTKNNHYIPVFYQKGFACLENPKLVYTHILDRKETIGKPVSPKTQGFRRNYYSQELEDKLADVESPSSILIRKLSDSFFFEISEQDREILSLFLATLFWRVPSRDDIYYQHSKNSINDSSFFKEDSEILKSNGYSESAIDEIERELKIKFSSEEHYDEMIINWIDNPKESEIYKWFLSVPYKFVRIAKNNREFITGDNPVCISSFPNVDNKVEIRKTGFINATAKIPICKNLMLICDPRLELNSSISYCLSDSDIDSLNDQVAMSCEHFIIGSHPKLLDVVSTRKLNNSK